ncbi:anti-Muellerian hormone type-2 receptor [Amia ocellicauda]|uniref:anti-Muellerian hormone type-2 receptor n=1 Tax=Amia ocellicauda TaxID=2972642 RepID=UPI0034645656
MSALWWAPILTLFDVSLGRRCTYYKGPYTSIEKIGQGNISGNAQSCTHSSCCTGIFRLVNGQPIPDWQGCSKTDDQCSDICTSTQLIDQNYTTCVCNSDFCNAKLIWVPADRGTHGSDMIPLALSLGGFLLIMVFGFLVLKRKWRQIFQGYESLWCAKVMQGGTVTSLCLCERSERPALDFSNIELQQVLGKGSNAKVWQGTLQGTSVVFKVYPPTCHRLYSTEREVYELPLMEHSSIIRFLGAGTSPETRDCMLVLELAPHGSLHSYLSQNITDWPATVKLGLSLAEGLAFLHAVVSRNDLHKPAVAHRDLSSSNILVKADGTCALCDFGFSTILCSSPRHQGYQLNSDNRQVCARLGTLRYLPPEILDGNLNFCNTSSLKQADVYALGLLLWEISMRCRDLSSGAVVPEHRLPYEAELSASPSLEELLMLVSKRGARPQVPARWRRTIQGRTSLSEILENCWDHDPEARLTAQCAADRLAALLPP